MSDQLDDPPLSERAPAPEILADGFASVSVVNGVAKFAFFSVAHDPQGGQHERRVVLRLSVPLPAIPGIQQAIGDLLDQVGAMGQSPPQKPLGSPPPD